MKKKSLFLATVLLIVNASLGQQLSSPTDKHAQIRNHIVKLDATARVWYKQAVNLSFEQRIKPQQSASITIGIQELNLLNKDISNEQLKFGKSSASGFKIAADYRFYLAKENKYAGMHGIYLGPYFAYHRFNNDWDIAYNSTNSGLQTGALSNRINITNIGAQAGYQFLIGNRWCVDLNFIGASASRYYLKSDINGNFDLSNSEINQELLDALAARFPLIGDIIDDGNIDTQGNLNKWSFGFRYQIQVGYAFGGRKKK